MKRDVDLARSKWLVEPGCVVLVTSGTMEKPNVMTFSWQTPVNTSDPCLIVLAISHVRYSYELIRQNNELVINVPGEELLDQVHYVGTVSGRDADKLRTSGLTIAPAQAVRPPLIAECAGHLECKVVQTFEMESHDLLVCEVVGASAEADFFDGRWIPEKFHSLHYLCGNLYGLLDRTVKARPIAGS